MAMEYSSTRSFTLTLAYRAVGDIRRGGFRQLRNYVDMCATLAKKPQQKDFFACAQAALQRTDSCYYSMIHNLLDSVDDDRICTVGVNLGFGGLIYGASKMKVQADTDRKPFSWVQIAQCGDAALADLVPAAAKQGSYVWVLDATRSDPADAAALALATPESVFGILAEPETLTGSCIEALLPCMNIVVLPLLHTPELTPEACLAARALKKHRMMYMLTIQAGEDEIDSILQPDWVESIAQESLFCMISRRGDVTPETSKQLRSGIVAGRLETGLPVLMLDWEGDIAYLNRHISEYAVLGNHLPEGYTFPLGTRF